LYHEQFYNKRENSMTIWLNLLQRWLPPVVSQWRKRRVGLVLSGGAVWGAAHLGVLQVFDEVDFQPDLVVGVSAGSLVGGLYCAGLSPLKLQQVAREMKWRQIGHFIRPGLGLFDISPLEKFVDDLTGGITLADLKIPFAAVAADILASELVVFKQGRLGRAIRASCSVPGLCSPVEDGKQLLVDGGILNNLPVGVAQDMGANYMITVDLWPSPASVNRPHNLVEMCSLAISMRQQSHLEAQCADVLIQPDIAHLSYIDFKQTDTLVQKGREAALAHIAQIKSDLGWRHDGGRCLKNCYSLATLAAKNRDPA
jgi:NTE family protein